VELLVVRALSHYLLLPWAGGLSDTQQDWQQRSATLTLLLHRTLRDFMMLSHQIVRQQAPSADMLIKGMLQERDKNLVPFLQQ